MSQLNDNILMMAIIINVQLFFLDAQIAPNCIPQPLDFKFSMPPS